MHWLYMSITYDLKVKANHSWVVNNSQNQFQNVKIVTLT